MATNPVDTTQNPQERAIQAVAFDLDGLMFNTEDLYDEVLDEMLQARGHRFTRELKLSVMGLPSLKAANGIIQWCGLSDDPAELIDEAHHLLAEILPCRLQPMPGLLDLLEIIETAGLPKSVATSSSPVFAERALTTAGLRQRFEFVLTAEDVKQGKPYPDIYLESARRHGVLPAHMLVLEDSLIGSRAGAAAGAITVAIPTHHSVEQVYESVDFRFESLAHPQLQSMLKRRCLER